MTGGCSSQVLRHKMQMVIDMFESMQAGPPPITAPPGSFLFHYQAVMDIMRAGRGDSPRTQTHPLRLTPLAFSSLSHHIEPMGWLRVHRACEEAARCHQSAREGGVEGERGLCGAKDRYEGRRGVGVERGDEEERGIREGEGRREGVVWGMGSIPLDMFPAFGRPIWSNPPRSSPPSHIRSLTGPQSGAGLLIPLLQMGAGLLIPYIGTIDLDLQAWIPPASCTLAMLLL